LSTDFCPGLNVFIGENGTGKSHLMKLIYGAMSSFTTPSVPVSNDLAYEAVMLGKKLAGLFRPDQDQIGRLVRRKQGRGASDVAIDYGDGKVSFHLTTLSNLSVQQAVVERPPSAIFIPTREALSMYPGFVAAYENRELSFDETYFDLCKSLSGSALRGPRLQEAKELLEPIETILGGTVRLDGGQFYVHVKSSGAFEAHLLAEGHRKLASIAHLVANGSLGKNSILFWDDPEANLNPRLIPQVVRTLRSLVTGGVQVFVATHDFLLSQELALLDDFATERAVATQFFSFTKKSNKAAVTVDCAERLSQLASNPILDSLAAHYDQELKLVIDATKRN